MKITLLFYSRAAQNRLYPLMARQMDNFNTIHIVQNDKEQSVVEEIEPDAVIYNLTQFIKANWTNQDELSKVLLNEIEEFYEIESLWKMFYADRFLPRYNYEDSLKFIKLHFLFIKNIIDEVKPSFFINEEVAMFSGYLFYVVGKKHGCKYIGFSAPRNFTYEKFLFTQDEYTHYYELDHWYKNNNLSQAELSGARGIIADIKKTKSKPEYMLKQGLKPRFKLQFFLSPFRFLYYWIVEKNESFDYTFILRSNAALEGLKHYIRYIRQKRYFFKPNENENFILFPLHYQPEASTLTKATDFENQLNTIEILSKNIPGDYILYVKEHYARLGHKNMNFYKTIRKFPNVKLIDPWVDSHTLIQQCKAVITLTSTVGWEALIYGKPVFILGNVFYETFKYSIKVFDVYHLAESIKSNISKMSNEINDFNEEFIKYFAAYLKAMKRGNYILKQYPDKENVASLSHELELELNKFNS